MIPRFAYLGTPQFASTILEGLIRYGWPPALVLTEPDKPVGRKQLLTPSAVKVVAKKHDLSVATPHSGSEIAELLSGQEIDLAVVAAYGRILPSASLDVPKYGAVNVHASLLPKYRGAAPIQAAILAGDTLTGVSFMLVEPTLDTGPVLESLTLSILPTDTTPTLSEKLAGLAAQTIGGVLSRYLAGTIAPTPQDDSRASYAPKIKKTDGKVSLTSIDPEMLDRMVRAYCPWPGVYTEEFGTRLILRGGHLNDGCYVITELQWAGKQPVSAPEFAQAYPQILTSLPERIRINATTLSV